MLTGKVPFDADTPVSVALKHMQEQPVEPININPAIPTAVNKIVMKAMRKDPNLRYQTATEMLKDLTLSLKNPDGNFVSMASVENDFPTQVIPTIEQKNIQDKIKEKDESKGKKKKKDNFFARHGIFTAVIVLMILFGVSLGGTVLVFNLTKSKDIQVPNLVGKTVEEAQNTLKDTKLNFEVLEEKYDVTVEKGLVISQQPEYKPNYNIKENTTMQVVVSLGQKLTIVPKVTGMEESEARKALEDKELEVVVVEEFDKKVEKGIVIKQDVDAEQEVGAGSTVTITVSKGIEETTVPNIVGKSQADAIAELEGAGIKVSTTLTEEDRTRDDGVVLKQSLEAGSSVEKGSSMTITVNQIRQLVNGTVKINLKSLTNYKEQYENKVENVNSNTTNTATNTTTNTVTNTVTKVPIAPKDVKVRVMVENDNVYEKSHKENDTNITVPISGIGTVTIKVYIDDVLGNRTKTINLSEQTEVIFE